MVRSVTFSEAHCPRPESVNFIMRHPDIFPSSADDFCPKPEEIDFYPCVMSPGAVFFLIEVNNLPVGYIMFRHSNRICCDIHCGFLRDFRGAFAKSAMSEAIDHIFSQGVVKITAEIVRSHKAALRMVAELGFKREGVNYSSFVRNGRIEDQIYVGLVRDAWCS